MTRSDRRYPDPRRRRYHDADDNVGSLGVNTDGNLTVGLGNGLAIDTEDGSLGLDLGGFVVDFDE